MTFNVKKMGSISAVAVALFAASWGAHAVTANTATAPIHFKAVVVDQTCTPNWDATKGVDIDFKNVSAKDLKALGDIGSIQPFTLSLTDCEGVKGVTVTSTGTADQTDKKAFANTSTDATPAKNVAFVLMGGADQKTQLTPDNGSVEYQLAKNATGIDMSFLAELVATGQATTGPASGLATLYMTYE